MEFKFLDISWLSFFVFSVKTITNAKKMTLNVRFFRLVDDIKVFKEDTERMIKFIGHLPCGSVLGKAEDLVNPGYVNRPLCNSYGTLINLEPVKDEQLMMVWFQIVITINNKASKFTDINQLASIIYDRLSNNDKSFIEDYIKVSQPKPIACKSEKDLEINHTWPDSEVHVTHSVIYPPKKSDAIRYISRYCNSDGWDPVIHHKWTGVSISCDPKNHNVVNLLCHPFLLNYLRENAENVPDSELEQILHNMISSCNNDSSILTNTVIKAVLKFISRVTETALCLNSDNSKLIRDFLDLIVTNYPISKGSFQFKSAQISMVIHNITKLAETDWMTYFEIISPRDDKIEKDDDVYEFDDGLINILTNQRGPRSNKGVSIPVKSILESKPGKNKTIDRIGLHVSSDAFLFPTIDDILTEVYSLFVPGMENIKLKKNITLTFGFDTTIMTKFKMKCVYWDSAMLLGQGGWSTSGCSTIFKSIDRITCHCNHLSSFALMRVSKLNKHHITRLKWISIIGCSLSAVALTLTLITYLSFKPLTSDIPSKILVFICMNLLLTNMLYILNVLIVHRDTDDNNTMPFNNTDMASMACLSTAVLFHYFLLASICWMGANGYHMYRSVVDVFGSDTMSFQKLALFASGLPMVIVIFTVCFNFHSHYGLVKEEICWLKGNATVIAFYIPVALILSFNIYIFLIVFNRVTKMIRTDRSNSNVKNITIQLRGGVSITLLLGLTWSFAFLATGWGKIVFAYLFVACNAFQGFFLFIFYCVLKENARLYWIRWFHRMRTVEVLVTTKTTQSMHSGNIEAEYSRHQHPQTLLRSDESMELSPSTTVF